MGVLAVLIAVGGVALVAAAARADSQGDRARTLRLAGIGGALVIAGLLLGFVASGASSRQVADASSAPSPTPAPDYADHQLTNQEIAERSSTSAPSTDDGSADNAPAPATEAPTPKPRPVDHHAERKVARDWWNRIIIEAAVADGARQGAIDAISAENLVAASALVKKAHQYSLDASNQVSEGVPDGWDDVAEHMSNAMAGFAAMYDKLQNAIDDFKPSTMVAAGDDNDNANAELEHAVHLARVHYVAMGGKWNDITDGSSEAHAMGSIVHALDGTDQ